MEEKKEGDKGKVEDGISEAVLQGYEMDIKDLVPVTSIKGRSVSVQVEALLREHRGQAFTVRLVMDIINKRRERDGLTAVEMQPINQCMNKLARSGFCIKGKNPSITSQNLFQWNPKL